MSKSTINLIPWDANSSSHVERMRQQRIACGWKRNKLGDWQRYQDAGELIFYWIVLPPDHPGKDALLQRHFAEFPEEAEPLQDTCEQVLGRPRTPEYSSFTPVGHICLDGCIANHAVNRLMISLENGAYAIAAFYISHVLQGSGIGSLAMSALERLSAEQFGTRTITLCTRSHADTAVDSPRRIALGLPETKVSNAEWYQRRGYIIYEVIKDGVFDVDPTGKEWGSTLLYLKKDLA